MRGLAVSRKTSPYAGEAEPSWASSPFAVISALGATTHATTREATKRNAARYHGAPGRDLPGAMKRANVPENIPGPITMAMPRSEPSAPCSSPCSEGETRSVMSDCEGGPASDHRQLIGMAAMKIHPLAAQPERANPTR